MTKSEAARIPELQIHPDELVEDCFYYRMAVQGRLSDEQGKGSFIVADMMIANLDKYGVACIDWCK